MVLKSSTVTGVIARLDKALHHESELTTIQHPSSAEALDVLAQNGRYTYTLGQLRSMLDVLLDANVPFERVSALAISVLDASSRPIPFYVIHDVIERGVGESFEHSSANNKMLRDSLHKDDGFATHFYRVPVPAGQASEAENEHAERVYVSAVTGMNHFGDALTAVDKLDSFCTWLSALLSVCPPVGSREHSGKVLVFYIWVPGRAR